MDRSKRLGQGSIPRLLMTFSAPAIVGMLAQAIYNVVDRIFVGHAVGPEGIAATTVSFPFMLIGMAFSMLIGLGTTALVSMRLGQKKKDEAEQVLGNAVVLLLCVALFLTTTGLILLVPLLKLFGASEQILPYARQYMRILVMGSIFQAMGFGLNAVIRGEGNPRIAMYTMLIGALLNTLLDPLFLFGFGWGMRGAAASTVISQAVSASWVLGYFLFGNSLLKIRVKYMKPRWSICVMIVAIGSPMFAMQIAASVMNAILNNQLRVYGGDLAISVMGIINSVAMFFAMPMFGINQGSQPIIGYNHGAREHQRVRKTVQTAILFASAICITGFIIVMLFPVQVIWLFNRRDVELARMGVHAIRICLMMFPVIGFQIVSTGYFQAIGKPKQAMFLGLSRQVLLLIPAILILPCFFGLDGVWAAIPTADFCSALLTGTWLFVEMRKLRTRSLETSPAGTEAERRME